jgi:hypothetical protein
MAGKSRFSRLTLVTTVPENPKIPERYSEFAKAAYSDGWDARTNTILIDDIL